MQNFRVYEYITLWLFTELGFLNCMPNHIEAFDMSNNNQGLQPCKFKGREKKYKRGIRQNKMTKKLERFTADGKIKENIKAVNCSIL